MSTTPVTPNPTPGSGGTSSTNTGIPSAQSLNNMFLQLLVAQLQNQDPTDPVDPSTFVGQLAQFSELSEVTSIYQLLQSNLPSSGTSSTGTSGTGSGGTGGTGSTGGTGTPSSNSAILNTGNGVAKSFAGTIAGGSAKSLGISAPVAAPATTAAPPATIAPTFVSPPLSAIINKLQGGF
jgi:flagellar basal-body rod modification protein FlgD